MQARYTGDPSTPATTPSAGGIAEALTAAVQLGRQTVGIQRIEHDGHGRGVPVMLVPKGYVLQDLKPMVPALPDRIRQIVHMVDLQSFIRYVKEHQEPRSRVFAEALAAPYSIVCILDYHEPHKHPSWCTHRVRLFLTETDAWKAWTANDGKAMGQVEFAEFIEEHQPDIVTPPGATMLELAKSLTATQGVNFKNRIVLENGDSEVLFDQTTKAAAGLNGKIDIPKRITIKVAPFLGMPDVAVYCRFRYRLDPPTLRMAYEIERKQQFLLDTVQGCLDIIEEGTKISAFLGQVFEGRGRMTAEG